MNRTQRLDEFDWSHYHFHWGQIVLGVAGVCLMIVSVSQGALVLAAVNAFCALTLLSRAYWDTYYSVPRCPFCGNRAPGHRNGCRNYYHSGHWDE